MHRKWIGLCAALALCIVPACELGDDEGGGGSGLGPEQTVTFSSVDTLDGWVRDDGNRSTSGSQVIVGDLVASGVSRGYRGFYSFDITSIPAGSSVTSATLRVFQFSFTGTPYTDLGNVIADHLDYGAVLDAPDYDAAPIALNIGTVSTNTNLEYKTLTVTARVQADVDAGRPRAQFRLRFSITDNNNDGNTDLVQFSDAEYFTADVPQLVVKYREPAP